jgi:branched-chain amino acid transport system substrate-binding protein
MNKVTRYILVVLAVIFFIVTAIHFANRPSPPQHAQAKRVLVVLPLTGPAASWGEHFKRGVDMFLRTHKDSRLEIQIIDSQTNPASTMSAVQQASLAGKPYAIVSTLSSITVPLKEWTEEERVPLVACVITDKVLQNAHMVQRIYPSVESNARPLAQYAKSKFRRVAILYSNEELGLAVRRVFESDYIGDGRTVILTDGYALKDTEVRSIVAKFVQARPEAILITGIGPAFWAIIRELRTQGYPGQILSDASFADPVQIDKLGSLAEGIVFAGSETELSEPRTQRAKAFNRQFTTAFGVPVNYTGVTVYESLSILNQLAKSNLDIKNDSFTTLGEWQGVPGTLRFLEDGDCDYPWFLIKRKQNHNVALTK